jgi:chemotaxis signal transduction protein
VTISPHPDETPGAGPAAPDDTPGAGPAAAARVILEERARALARPIAPDEDGDGLVVLGFTVAGRAYAVEVGHVREVLARADVSRLPWGPPAISGVTNVRGEIVPVADTARVLGVGEVGAGGPVVVLDGGGHVLGLHVDAVDDVTSIPAGTLVAPAGDPARVTRDLVLGLTPSTVVLDARALYADPRLTNLSQEGT